MNGLRNWSLGLLGTVIAVTISYLWLDRPIAQLAHDQLQHYRLFEKLTLIPEGLAPLAIVALVVLVQWICAFAPLRVLIAPCAFPSTPAADWW